MSKKQDLIRKMLEMQREFIKKEHESGLDPRDYYAGDDSTEGGGYNKEYTRLANELVDLAHEEKGSHR